MRKTIAFCCLLMLLSSCAARNVPVGPRGEVKLDVGKSGAPTTGPTEDKSIEYHRAHSGEASSVEGAVGVTGSVRF